MNKNARWNSEICNDELAYREILNCTNKDLVLDSDRYWDGVECEVFNLKIK
jgi:hypothetical protein